MRPAASLPVEASPRRFPVAATPPSQDLWRQTAQNRRILRRWRRIHPEAARCRCYSTLSRSISYAARLRHLSQQRAGWGRCQTGQPTKMIVTLALLPEFSPGSRRIVRCPFEQVDAEDCSRWSEHAEMALAVPSPWGANTPKRRIPHFEPQNCRRGRKHPRGGGRHAPARIQRTRQLPPSLFDDQAIAGGPTATSSIATTESQIPRAGGNSALSAFFAGAAPAGVGLTSGTLLRKKYIGQ